MTVLGPTLDPTSLELGRSVGLDRSRALAVWGLPVLLAATAVLYLWDLDVSGSANAYYTAAADAGSQSWKAFFFGSLDASNAATVDKPPLFLWPMALSVRAFGFSSWSVLVPQALEGVASVWLLHECVRRATGSRIPALLAGSLMALTPVCTLMFRYDNPDAMLTMLLLAAALVTHRAVDADVTRRAGRWLVLAGVLVGLAFLTKMLVALLVLPALTLAYALYGRSSLRTRVAHVLAAGVGVVVGGGWWVATVELWPTSSRPYISGSSTNSVVELALGYNGVQRITGTGSRSLGESGLAATNLGRIAHTNLGAEIVWLVPAALILGVVGLLLVRRLDSSPLKPSLVLWLTWLGVLATTFAAMAGIFHSYYTVVLAPAVAALVATGGWVAWGARDLAVARWALTVAGVATSVVSAAVLVLYLAPTSVLALPVLALGVAVVRQHRANLGRPALVALLAIAVIGPVTFSMSTALQAHTGSGPMSGPGHGAPGVMLTTPVLGSTGPSRTPNIVRPISSDLTALMVTMDRHYPWVAATDGARTAAAYEIATGRPLIAIGGYKGTDPTPTLAEFRRLVARDEVPLYVVGGTSGPAAEAIRTWVQERFATIDVADEIVYDLRASSTFIGRDVGP